MHWFFILFYFFDLPHKQIKNYMTNNDSQIKKNNIQDYNVDTKPGLKKYLNSSFPFGQVTLKCCLCNTLPHSTKFLNSLIIQSINQLYLQESLNFTIIYCFISSGRMISASLLELFIGDYPKFYIHFTSWFLIRCHITCKYICGKPPTLLPALYSSHDFHLYHRSIFLFILISGTSSKNIMWVYIHCTKKSLGNWNLTIYIKQQLLHFSMLKLEILCRIGCARDL